MAAADARRPRRRPVPSWPPGSARPRPGTSRRTRWPTTSQPASADLPEQMRVRRDKLDRLRAAGIEPYPVHVAADTTIGAAARAVRRPAAGHPDRRAVSVAGRVMLNRIGGKLCFATLQDGTGQIQVMLSLADVGEEALDRWQHDVDLGDHVSVTRRGGDHPARRAVGARRLVDAERQVPAPAAGQAPRLPRRRRPGSGSATST